MTTSEETRTGPLAVEARGLVKTFGDFTAVAGIDLAVAPATVTALLGPNGAGKTTNVRMLGTLSQPTAGSAKICSHDVVTEADRVRQMIALTGQFAALEDNLTARENLVLMARLRGYGARAGGQVADELIERFDMGEFRGSLVKEVSGGQRRRVDLAASLVTRPEVLVLDEPTTGLDPRSRQTVWSTVRNLVADGVTVLLTTQYLEEADQLADQILLIDHGRAVATGSPNELKATIGGQRVDILAATSRDFDQLEAALTGFEVSTDRARRTLSVPAPQGTADLLTVGTAVRAVGAEVEELALRRPTLDDAFLGLTGQLPEGESVDEADPTEPGAAHTREEVSV